MRVPDHSTGCCIIIGSPFVEVCAKILEYRHYRISSVALSRARLSEMSVTKVSLVCIALYVLVHYFESVFVGCQ